ncbi:MAG TPA: aspartate dehydrogenase [Xanthobacteraceae bacterium]|nr:aspartate dehydrogenase [Xanthobacteraceae bacterium]
MTSVGLIGYGGIARDVVAALREAGDSGKIVGALCRPGRVEQARTALGGIDIVESLDDLLARRPSVVAEVAGQQAVAEHGPDVLRRGVDLMVISIGALADLALLDRLKAAARDGDSRILLPAGAIGGLDAIAAMRVGGLHAVRYRSRKPPAAWRGSPAEKVADLDRLNGRTVLYRGSAGEAALLYPQNANVAAAVALAGLGFDKTEVELVADPEAPGNVHEIEAEGAAGRFAIQLQGRPSRTNPKTSALAALSVARALINLDAAIVI